MGKRLQTQRRGAGKPHYLSPSHHHKGMIRYPTFKDQEGIVKEITHNPGKTAPLAIIEFDNGERIPFIPPEGMMIGDKVSFTNQTKLKPGNVLPLSSIPEGTPIYNIEAEPRDGGKFVRSAGNTATVISHGETIVVKLPSGKFKKLNPSCRATIGIVSGGGRRGKPFLKAGKKYHSVRSKSCRYPIVRGVAMNPVDHPHGGGAHQHVGTQSSVSRNAPPGRKVGNIAPKRTGKR
jgi:large subunit ribosomal protein L2